MILRVFLLDSFFSLFFSLAKSSSLICEKKFFVPDDCTKEDGTKCQNGVCLDSVCHCNDGFGGCNCQVPGLHTTTSYYCTIYAYNIYSVLLHNCLYTLIIISKCPINAFIPSLEHFRVNFKSEYTRWISKQFEHPFSDVLWNTTDDPIKEIVSGKFF